MVVEYYKDKSFTLDQVRRQAQGDTRFNEAPCTGINHIEVLNALEGFGINHYRVGFGSNTSDVLNYVEIGPVIVGVHYGSYPIRAQAEVGGKTDHGFNGAHAVLAIGKRVHDAPKDRHRDIFVRDPDHNSPARPEKPDFDRIRRSQLQRAMENLPRYTAFSNTYILYPTRRKSL